MKRAFTLIELLVVIAIIAILAAILFPVFAQAKESARKVTAISNLKQMGIATVGYCTDNEDVYPIMQRTLSGGQVVYNMSIGTPAGWNQGGAALEIDGVAWPNSIQPYAKNFKITTVNGQNVYFFAPNVYQNPKGSWQNGSASLNGLLASYPTTAVASPSKLTLAWFGNMKEEIEGFNYTNPLLICAKQPCYFKGPNTTGDRSDYTYGWLTGKMPQNETGWVVGKGMPFVNCDTSVRFVQLNPGGTPTANNAIERSYKHPVSAFGKNGMLKFFHTCRDSATEPAYLSFFRPDSEFDYKFGQGVLCH